MSNSDNVYIKGLQKEAQKISENIEKLEIRNHGLYGLTGIPSKRIANLTTRYNNIINEINNYNNANPMGGKIVGKIDKQVEKNNSKTQDIQNEIDLLKQTRNRLTTERGIEKIDRKIKSKNWMYDRLIDANEIISKGQNILILPKKIIDLHRIKLVSKAETNVNIMTDNIEYNRQLQSMLNPGGSFKDSVLDIVYDIKGMFYESMLEHAKETLNTMQSTDSVIRMQGASAIVLKNKVVDKLKNRLQGNQNVNTAGNHR